MDTLLDTPVQTRSRSRSKTPFLRSSCDRENCRNLDEGHVHERKKSKSPSKKSQIQQSVIQEEIEEYKEDKKMYQSKKETTTTRITSNYSSNEITSPESSYKAKIQTKLSSSNLGTSRGAAVTSTNDNHNSTIYSPNITSGSKSHEYNYSSKSTMATSTPIGSSSKKSISFSTKNGDLSNHLAYKEYKEAGEYWNKYPKTDYTYSRLSTHRREIAPGVIAMPNMSRRSLEKHRDRVDDMIQQNPSQETYIRQRYQPDQYEVRTRQLNDERYEQMRRKVEKYSREVYSSEDEVDYLSKYRSRRNLRSSPIYVRRRESLFVRIMTRIVSIFTYLTSFLWDQNELYRVQRIHNHEQGIFQCFKSAIVATVLKAFTIIHLAISSIQYLDVCLLKSPPNAAENKRKLFRIFLLIFLPLLLLAWLHYNDDVKEYTHRFINTIPSFTLPTMTIFNDYLTTTKNWKDSLKFNVSSILFPLWFQYNDKSSLSSSSPSKKLIDDLKSQKILTDEEYDRIIDYINKYIQKSIDDRLIDERAKTIDDIKSYRDNISMKINDEMSKLIANTVHENIIAILPSVMDAMTTTTPSPTLPPAPPLPPSPVPSSRSQTTIDNTYHHHHYEFNEVDIERIVESIRDRLLNDDKLFEKYSNDQNNKNQNQRFVLTQENLDEISKLIKHNIEINNEHYNFINHIDIDKLLLKILKSPNLSDYIDTRIIQFLNKEKIHENKINEEQNMKINDITFELNNIQMKLKEYENEKINLKKLIDLYIAKQDDIKNDLNSVIQENSNKLNTLEMNTNSKIDEILEELNRKVDELNETQLKIINKQMKMYIVEILGYKGDRNIDDINLQEWIQNTFVAKDYLDERLSEFDKMTNQNFQNEIERSKIILLKEITDKMRLEIIKMINEKHETFNLNENEIKNIVKNALELYDADKTGLVDYALESAGGQVLSTRCTENYHMKSAQISVFGIPLWYPSNTPRIAISPAVQPGECWAFQGFPGFLVLKLNAMVYVTGFTLEHIPRSLSPNGKIDSAPKNFTVWGLNDENDQEPVLFGEYEYQHNGTSWQYFPVQNQKIRRPFDIVEVRIESNHGNLAYTCLYRFRVHGTPTS